MHDVTSRAGQNRSSGYHLRLIACFMVVANLTGFAVAPSIRFAAQYHSDPVAMLLVAIAAALLGSAFPMICHVSIPADRHPGSTLSLLYFSNIVGSALGSFLIGFVLMNLWGVQTISVVLVTIGIALAIILLAVSKPSPRQLAAGLTGCIAAGGAVIVFAQPLFNGLYESMLTGSSQGAPFRHLVENRSGVLAVSQNGTVFGGGAYDGVFNVDLVHDLNGLVRVYALSSFDRAPRHVLMIGLASGSWAQVVANHPKVEDLTIVEINPGYFEDHPSIPGSRKFALQSKGHDRSRLRPTMAARPSRSQVRSHRYEHQFQLARAHVESPIGAVSATGAPSYDSRRNSLLQHHFFSGSTANRSDGISLRTASGKLPCRERCANRGGTRRNLRSTLREYQIDGRPVLNPDRPGDFDRLNEMIAMARRFNSVPSFENPSMEYANSIRARYRGARIVTDDNMGLSGLTNLQLRNHLGGWSALK